GRFDLSFVFIERCIRQLSHRGVLALVIPNRLFGNRDASAARGIITGAMGLDFIVDFGSVEVFSGVSAYVGLIVGSRNLSPRGAPVRVLQVEDLPDRFQGAQLSLAASGAEGSADGIRAFDAAQPTGNEPWHFTPPEERKARIRVENASRPLTDFAQVWQ